VALGVAREATGFVIGSVTGLVLGALLGLSPLFNRIVGPSFNTFKQIAVRVDSADLGVVRPGRRGQVVFCRWRRWCRWW
jgi:hypothetical protein